MNHPLDELNTDPVFLDTHSPLLVIDDALVIRAVNPSYLEVSGRECEDLIGELLFDVFPDNPDDPAASGVTNLTASFESVFRNARHHWMALQRYDVRGPGDAFVRRFWTPVNSPLHDSEGHVVGVLHHVEDVTPIVEPILEGKTQRTDDLDDTAWNKLVGMLLQEVLAHQHTHVVAGQLQEALSHRVIIEQAKGVVTATWRVSPDEAFTVLRGWARSANLSLHVVCADVVETLELPPPVVTKVNTRRAHGRPPD